MTLAILYGSIDIAALAITAFFIFSRRISITMGALLILSAAFAPHAIASLVYAEPGSVNPDIVYNTIPLLRKWHIAFGTIPIFMIMFAAWKEFPQSNNKIVPAVAHILPLIIILVSYLISPNKDLKAEYYAYVAFFVVGLAALISLSNQASKITSDYSAIRFFVYVAALSLFISVIEIAMSKVRAATVYELLSPDYHLYIAYRASGLFNNPNWQGNWCGMLALACAWCIQRNIDRQIAIVGLVLAVLCIYLSGSRGSVVVTGAVLALFVILSWRRHLVSSALTCGVVFATSVAVDMVSLIGHIIFPNSMFTTNMFALHYRWVSQSMSLILAIVGKLLNKQFVADSAPAAESVLGRMSSSEGSDNGLAPVLALGDNLFWALVPLILAILWASVRILRSWNRADTLPFATAALLFSVLLPLQLRALSVFPIWIFEAAMIAVVLSIGISSKKSSLDPVDQSGIA